MKLHVCSSSSTDVACASRVRFTLSASWVSPLCSRPGYDSFSPCNLPLHPCTIHIRHAHAAMQRPRRQCASWTRAALGLFSFPTLCCGTRGCGPARRPSSAPPAAAAAAQQQQPRRRACQTSLVVFSWFSRDSCLGSSLPHAVARRLQQPGHGSGARAAHNTWHVQPARRKEAKPIAYSWQVK